MERIPEQMSWYDPVRKSRGWARVPASDPEAMELLRGVPDSDLYVETYSYWRELGAPITHSLYRASAAAQERDLSERDLRHGGGNG